VCSLETASYFTDSASRLDVEKKANLGIKDLLQIWLRTH
jgi:hypothetical protein